MIKSVYRNLKDKKDIDNYASYSFISSWANNYNSWKNSNIKNKLVIKYEELENHPVDTFKNVIIFINNLLNNKAQVDVKKLNKSIQSTKFDKMKKMEEKKGFDEAIYSSDGSKKPFFNLGRKNNYKNLLSKETTKEIEDAFNKEMVELGYL